MTRKSLLSEAVRCALFVGVSAVACSGIASAQDTPAPKSDVTLGTVTVTGSRIKRVDMETSSPIFEIDRAAIDRSGALTIGSFLQSIPAIAGAATNPAVNNGGGDGAATVSLRGLGDERTLILINGRRVVTRDVNAIPMSMVSRVEVLKDGASAAYGTDAIGGVVNFILKSDYSGVEATINYGISDHDDGERKGASATLGWNSDRGNVIISANYNDQKQVNAADRAFSAFALTLYQGVVTTGGSSRIPTGRYLIPESAAPGLGCTPSSTGNIKVTRIDGLPGTSVSDFRCLTSSDTFNYQGVGNVELTPQERAGLFISSNFEITDNVTGYLDAFVNKTRSAFQIAPLPFDGRPSSDNIVISGDNYYNPFGVDIADSRIRLSRLGNRRSDYSTDTSQLTFGLKGLFGSSSWSWDTGFTYGKIVQRATTTGYLLTSALQQGLGPSMLIGGVVTCVSTPGDPTTAIPGCIPIDFFGAPPDPATPEGQAVLANLAGISPHSTNQTSTRVRGFQANFAGDLFEMGAGTVQGAFGVEYRKTEYSFTPDFLARIELVNYTCQISAEACASTTVGSTTTKEVYGEVLIPLATDANWAKALNITLGTRYSDTTSGSTLNSKLGIEWRPNDDLLFRLSYAEVFRAPQVSDLYGGVFASSDSYTDPCNRFAGPADSNPACIGVPIPSSTQDPFAQSDTQLSAFHGGNANLKPETGTVFTYGVVYDPSWLPGFSAALDIWDVKLDDFIQTVGTQNILNKCFESTIAAPSPYCALFSRQPGGEILRLFDDRANVGRIHTNGIDMGLKYRRDTDGWGGFRASLDVTYLDKYDIEFIDPLTGDKLGEEHYAGHFVSPAAGGQGNYSHWRGLGNLTWTMGNWEAQWTSRYIHGFKVGGGSLCASAGSPPGSPDCVFSRGAQTYHNVQAGYHMKPWGLTARLGVDNLFDKQPPILYQNNTINGNTDERTFDTVGRYYWASLTVEFGAAAHVAPAPEVVAVVAPTKTCADLDDDGDGVNNCNDKCPGAGQGVGADGCPVPAPEPEPVMEPKPFRN